MSLKRRVSDYQQHYTNYTDRNLVRTKSKRTKSNIIPVGIAFLGEDRLCFRVEGEERCETVPHQHSFNSRSCENEIDWLFSASGGWRGKESRRYSALKYCAKHWDDPALFKYADHCR
jgi:hypothetical protein